MWQFRRKRKQGWTPWLQRFVDLTDAPETPMDVMKEHLRRGLDESDTRDNAATAVVILAIARAIHEHTGDATAVECVDLYDWDGFFDAWEKAETAIGGVVSNPRDAVRGYGER